MVHAVHQHLFVKTQHCPIAGRLLIKRKSLTGICPQMDFEASNKVKNDIIIENKSVSSFNDYKFINNCCKAAAKGMLEVMSEMGI